MTSLVKTLAVLLAISSGHIAGYFLAGLTDKDPARVWNQHAEVNTIQPRYVSPSPTSQPPLMPPRKNLAPRFRIFISKSTHRLILYDRDKAIKDYPVGLGAETKLRSTPTGRFGIVEITHDPYYYIENPKTLKEEGVTQPLAPPFWYLRDKEHRGETKAQGNFNALGTRWIAFRPPGIRPEEKYEYAIHGTNEPDSIGRSLGHGCVRMRNKDVEALTNILEAELLKQIELTIEP